MSPDTRCMITALAHAVASGQACAWIYDYDRDEHRAISASVTGDKAGAYDHARKSVMEGKVGETLLDHAANQHLTLERTATGVKGYDHASQAFYEATVQGERVSLYDYADSAYHTYAISRPAPNPPQVRLD